MVGTKRGGDDAQVDAQVLIQSALYTGDDRLDRSFGEIARGGMATIELAVDQTLGRRIALKLLHGDHQQSGLAVRSFIREAQITGQLDHPNIVPVHELARDEDGKLFFSMKLVEGRTLLERIRDLRLLPGQAPPRDARGRLVASTIEHEDLLRLIGVFLKVLDAVAFAHARGVVHCDIKPENIMVGDFGQVYLMDWGIARLIGEQPQRAPHVGSRVVRVRNNLRSTAAFANMIIGTPSYMSPEQARGDRASIDQRSDIFSLGAVLFEILTGHPPYQGSTAHEVVEEAVACRSMLLPHLPITQEMRRIVSLAMHPDPAQRYGDVAELRADLESFMRGGDNFPRRRFAKGEWLIREGEVGDAAYILVHGRCEVSRLIHTEGKVEDKRDTLRMLGPGDVFGETAILASSPRTASVRALTEVVAVVVTADALEREVDAMKPWMGSFIRALARRFTDVDNLALARSINPAQDPVQIAHLGLMTLGTWGTRDAEGTLTMSVLELCGHVATISDQNEDQVLKALRQYAQFDIDLTLDEISLARDARRGLVRELRPYLQRR
ncbi:probable serine/threonine-protein kinase pknB [Plesiocystis pacifica SIR-1]|uniref:Probable serine/threonine-protein kinase pknB n=1 Tax=Plesiocystis pacifica SIR-1 TaxID=391625 RepID=A6FXN0_9BACT|nr:protein kinase [Plesiocystis pacifica]EDM81618.1 probable serine/threonine-protein kinase pknB [Plesiocystis pacifica SIR-1]